MAKVKFFAVVTCLVSVVALASSFSSATTFTNPDPQIFVQNSTDTSPDGGDPNLLTDLNNINVGVAGSFTLQDPLLIIVGVYDWTAADGIPELSYSGCTGGLCSLASIGQYGLTTNETSYVSGTGKTAYQTLGLASGGSESFNNWSGADQANGLTAPTNFELFAFALPTNLTSGTNIVIDTTAALGSFVIGYDCEDGTATTFGKGCKDPGNIGQTPFTNAGLITTGPPEHKTPEPAGLALLGSGLVLIGGLLRRKVQ